jgi:hypothetical protein
MYAPARASQAIPPSSLLPVSRARGAASSIDTPSASSIAATRSFDFARIPIQRKPTISSPGDAFEREADAVADTVMRMAEPPAAIGAGPPAIQRKCTACEDDDKKVQRKHASNERRSAPLDARTAARAATHGGAPLSSEVRAFFEPRFGHDFSRVRVHTDGEAAHAARSVQARAYTYGRDIVFGAGQYAPSSPSGGRLLAHELTHVVQQGGRAPAEGGVIAREGPMAEPPSVEGLYEMFPETVTEAEQAEFNREREAGVVPAGTLGPTPYHDRGASTNWSAAADFRERQQKGQMRRNLLEEVMTVLIPGGDPPDFVTDGPSSMQANRDGENITYTPHYFHVLDAIEHWAEVSPTDEILLAVYKYVFADLVKPDRYAAPSTLRLGFPMTALLDMRTLDPTGSKRREAFKRGMTKRSRRLKPAAAAKPQPKIAPDADFQVDSDARRKGRDPCEIHLELPEGKRPHYPRYKSEVLGSRLAAHPTEILGRLRTTAYERESNQVRNWINALDPAKSGRMSKTVLDRGVKLLGDDAKCGKDKDCIDTQRRRVLKPDWAPDGTRKQMDVDHIIELQLGSLLGNEALDVFDNYELLDSSTNSSIGSTLDKALQKERSRLKRECPKKVPNWDWVSLVFSLPIFQGGGKAPGERWSSKQIIAGEHLDAYKRKSK